MKRKHSKNLKIDFFPKGTTEITQDGITWYDPKRYGGERVRFAKTEAGKFYRKPRECRDYRDWRVVTKAHVDAAKREGWYIKAQTA